MSDPISKPSLPPIRDWNVAYSNMGHVPNSQAIPEMWAKRAEAWRTAAQAAGERVEYDISYGSHPRETMDIVWPKGDPQGLVVFVHGGYWMRFAKDYFTDLAQGMRDAGWAVCLPSYALAPEVRISAITQQIGRAIEAAAARVHGPIRLAGHSAGGHLVSRMLCSDSPLSNAVLDRVTGCMSISGLHDLRPLLQTQLNETFQLDLTEARSESPALTEPRRAIPLTCWVGGGELPEFIRQSHLMADIWGSLDVPTLCHEDGSHNHFTVVDDLKSADAPITKALLGATFV